MSLGLALALLAAGILLAILRARSKLRGLQAGDLVKVEIPRKVERPLAMGTRLDCARALKDAGVAKEEIARLIDGKHDQELVDRYWALR